MVVHTRNALKIKMKDYYFDEHDDDDENDVDYIPPSSSDEDDDEDYMEEDDEEELENISTTSTVTPWGKNVLSSTEFTSLLKRVEELDPDIYKFITSDHIKDKDKIRI